MKLIYRGATYYYNSAQAEARRAIQPTHQSTYDLIYRGTSYRFDPNLAKPNSVKPSRYELIYRGTTYQVSRNAAGEIATMSGYSNALKHQAIALDAAVIETK
jgi:Domain of unknown function (DUF4278)